VVIDTNVALHQLDLLSHAAVTDVVVLSVVLEECRARSKAGPPPRARERHREGETLPRV
jgi:predicted ribonuclease YlaK